MAESFGQSRWSVDLGRWDGVHVRLHLFFLLFAVTTPLLSQIGLFGGEKMLGLGLGALAIWTASVLLHEVGRVQAARALGGGIPEIVLGPVGGLMSYESPHVPRRQLAVAIAGPAVQGAVCVLLAILLWLQASFPATELLNPLQPNRIAEGTWWIVGLKVGFWINWVLLLANLIPAYPFDGGPALKALLRMAYPRWPLEMATATVLAVSRLAALGLAIAAISAAVLGPGGATIPPWFALALLSVTLFFSGPRPDPPPEGSDFLPGEPISEGELDAAFEQSATSLPADEEDEPVFYDAEEAVSEWIDLRQDAGEEATEAHDEQRVDEILARVHQDGMASLSAEDRDFLERVSARYRGRPSR